MNYRISIYYIVDTLLLLLFVVSIFNIGYLHINKVYKKERSFLSLLLNAITVSMLTSLFVIKLNFGYIAAPNIGWFYKIPEGKTIVYPRVSPSKT